jgi:hypothetical protein
MPFPTQYYVHPTGLGNGDGLTAGNAHPMATTTDEAWLQARLREWNGELAASATYRGLNEATTCTTVTPGTDPDYGIPVYLDNVQQAVITHRVFWLNNGGAYRENVFDGRAADCGSPDSAKTTGTSTDPIRIFEHVAYSPSLAQHAGQRTPGIVSRSKSTVKATGAGDPANYVTHTGSTTAGVWYKPDAPRTAVTRTFTIFAPVDVFVTVSGSRHPDPRPQDSSRGDWLVNYSRNDTAEDYAHDPGAIEGSSPVLKDGNGNDILLKTGDQVNWKTKQIIRANRSTSVPQGSWGIRTGAGGVRYRGFRGTKLESMFDSNGAPESRWSSYWDCQTDNTRYFLKRNDQSVTGSGPQHDVEFRRLKIVMNSEKAIVHGKNCRRWFLSDIEFDGTLVVGTPICSLFGVQSGLGAGPTVVHRVITVRCWDAERFPQDNLYMQGDGMDYEGRGISVKHWFGEHFGDGAWDGKPSTFFLGFPAISICDAWLSRGKRNSRFWHAGEPTDRGLALHKAVMRDVTLHNPRQYGIFLTCNSPNWLLVDFYNPSGWPNYEGTHNFYGSTNEGKNTGDIDVVVWRGFDARDTTSATFRKHWQTKDQLNRGGTSGPYRNRVWTTTEAPPTGVTVSLDGVVVQPGTRKQVANAQTVQVTLSGLPAGATVTPTITGPHALTQTGNTIDATLYTTQP